MNGERTPRFTERRGVVLALTVGWALVMQRFGRGDIYWVVGAYAAIVLMVLVLVGGPAIRQGLRPTRRLVVLGMAVGVLMTATTYPAFWLTEALVPTLGARVAGLYAAARPALPVLALAWTMVILLAEEVLWRGAWVEAWTPRLGVTGAGVASVAAFAATQLGSGSAIVAMVAAACGLVWTGLRIRTGSLVPGLVAHAVWTPVV